MVLSTGKQLYFGAASRAQGWFEGRLGYPKFSHTSTVDYILDLVNIGFEDKDPATLMEPLVASSLQPSEEEDKVRLSGGDQESEAAPLRVWNLVRGDPEARRRLAQRLEAVSRVTEVKREKEVGEVEGSVLQGIRGFFQKIFTSL